MARGSNEETVAGCSAENSFVDGEENWLEIHLLWGSLAAGLRCDRAGGMCEVKERSEALIECVVFGPCATQYVKHASKRPWDRPLEGIEPLLAVACTELGVEFGRHYAVTE